MRGMCNTLWHDPGPCPVDDTPHTACTPESLAAPSPALVAIPVQRPRTLEPLTFTTATYRRAIHGRKARAQRARNEGA